ncbi:MAG: methylamine---glutamate N-methyltransferase subunit [Clostridia bacterium]|jgi:glutamate synthase domain-containing protein 2|nr:methylamine---glutamate N-methyltransferase subunit [Clostridia bacterium]MDN5322102.1 methylamine---glutamate N-methyltransferase subunit [Clostridia bacterium]
MSKHDNFFKKLLVATSLGITGYFGLSWLGRKTIKTATNSFINRLMVDKYQENIWEFVSASRKVGLQNIVETNLRSQEGKLIKRPLGSPRHFPGFDSIMFNFAQLHRLPTDEGLKIDTEVLIGPQAKKPLKIDIPILISGMAYGLALSSKAKIALAKGSALAGTATNTGEGPFLSAERKAAAKLILQYNRGKWNKSEKILKQADAIELYIGQGASGGTGHAISDKNIDWKIKRALGLKIGERAVIPSTFSGIKDLNYLNHLVANLKEITEGVPVGVKLAGSKYIEKDLEIVLDAGVDFIAIGGSEAGSKGSAPILQDDFGLPSLFALIRAADYLRERNCKKNVSLIMAGGFYNPGQMLKAIALGADAVYIGAIALFALSHTEVLKAIPWEPPPSIVFYKGHFNNKFNVKKGTQNLAKFLKACEEEIQEGIRALGKKSLKEVNKDDLFALDPYTSEVVGIPLGYKKISF